MTTSNKTKLIKVAIPLEVINAPSVREKSVRHRYPSTLHQWWARRPLAVPSTALSRRSATGTIKFNMKSLLAWAEEPR